MSYQEKLESALKELDESKVRAPIPRSSVFRLLTKYGINIRPFHYNDFVKNFFIHSIQFALIGGGLMWFFIWQPQDVPITTIANKSIYVGLMFGLLMAFYYKYSALKHNLRKWDKL